MTNYRDEYQPRISSSHRTAYDSSHENSTSLGGVLIGLAVIGLVFLALTLFFGNGGGNPPINPAVEQSAPAAAPKTTDRPVTATEPSN